MPFGGVMYVFDAQNAVSLNDTAMCKMRKLNWAHFKSWPVCKCVVFVPGLNEASFLEGAIEGSSNDSSLMEAEDIQLRAVESDESL